MPKKEKRRRRGGGWCFDNTSPVVLQRACKALLVGKCRLSKGNLKKLKRHKTILRKLANMKGTVSSKKAFVTRHKKQVGGILPFLPLIFAGLTAAGTAAGGAAKLANALS